MLNNTQTELDRYEVLITPLIAIRNYKKVVLQVPKEMLSISFQLTSLLKSINKDSQFYVLYDSLKQSCCTDVLGAQHIGYDCLFHFGPACFSSEHQPNHHYIFPKPEDQDLTAIREVLRSQETRSMMEKKNIGLIMLNQKYYDELKRECFEDYRLGGKDIQLMRMPMDRSPQDQYVVFGYQARIDQNNKKSILLISNQEDNQTSLAQQLSFSMKGLKDLVSPNLFTLNFKTRQIEELNTSNNKLLMQRYSLISQLDSHKIFGIIVSNTATTFHRASLQRCQDILKKSDKKVFTFMMNNLNEVKLGNFPEIEVYVIISCYQHSLFAIKDFHRLVVTPNDLESAFGGRAFDSYSFDCASKTEQKDVQPRQEVKEEKEELLQVEKAHSQLTLSNKIQTMDFYRERQFKGLEFEEKKEIKKFAKGKIGLAQEYKNLP